MKFLIFIKLYIKRIYTLFIALVLLFGFLSLNFSCNSNKAPKTELKDSVVIAKEDVIDDEFCIRKFKPN